MSHRKWHIIHKKGWRAIVIAIPDIKIALKIFPKENLKAAEREANVLKMLQDIPNVPRFYYFITSPVPILIREFIPGEPVIDYFLKASIDEIKHILKEMIILAKQLDERGIIVEELSRAKDNVIIYNRRPYIIDLERVSFTVTRSNITQILAWILFISKINGIAEKIHCIVNIDTVKDIAREYKRTRNFQKIMEIFKDSFLYS